jgi:predicted transcriptional regulator
MVTDYPQLSVRVPPDVHAKVAALAAVNGVPQWRVIIDAVERHVRAQALKDRQLISELCEHRVAPRQSARRHHGRR